MDVLRLLAAEEDPALLTDEVSRTEVLQAVAVFLASILLAMVLRRVLVRIIDARPIGGSAG